MRGYHWNIKGVNFFELHAKFEEIYTDLVQKVDEVAERILTLGYTPHNGYSQYFKDSRIKEELGVSLSLIHIYRFICHFIFRRQSETLFFFV